MTIGVTTACPRSREAQVLVIGVTCERSRIQTDVAGRSGGRKTAWADDEDEPN